MKHTIYDAKTGLAYELVGDYYLVAGEDEPKGVPIEHWGQRHLAFLKKRQRVVYRELQMNGRLNSYLAEIDKQATEMFDRLFRTGDGVKPLKKSAKFGTRTYFNL